MDSITPHPDDQFLGPYRLDRVIGRGGMGSVYLARHARSGEEVAVKLIAQHVADDLRFRRRFDAEVETLKRLRHPGIVRLIGYGEERGRLFYSMEMVHGQSLQQRIREVKRMGWLAAVDIAIQICSALKHAHDIGVIHRDLKPANLLLTEAGEVKLVDFGIAKLFGFGEQTLTGSVLGTADYMAPEQAGTGRISPRTDLYALGSVMYAMMAGRSPFAGKKITQVIESLKRDRPVPLDLINPEVPDEIVDIVHHLLEKDPDARPPTALSVMKRLQATRAGLQHERTIGANDDTQAAKANSGSKPSGSAPPLANLDTSNSSLTDVIDHADPDGQTNPTGQPIKRRTVPIPSASMASAAESPTLDSQLADENEDWLTASTQTRFQTVDESVGRRTTWLRSDDQEPSSPWMARLAATLPVVGMIAVLVFFAGLFYRATATPSADELYAELRAAEQSGETSLATAKLNQFLQEYPDDPRREQIEAWRDDAQIERMVKNLQAEARSVGGISQLNPMDQAFVTAMQMRERSGKDAAVQLAAWLDVFGQPLDLEPLQTDDPTSSSVNPLQAKLNERRRVQLRNMVATTLQELRDNPSPPAIDPRLTALRQRVAAAEVWSLEDRQRLLRGLVRLYSDDPWAKPLIDEVRQQLTALDRASQD